MNAGPRRSGGDGRSSVGPSLSGLAGLRALGLHSRRGLSPGLGLRALGLHSRLGLRSRLALRSRLGSLVSSSLGLGSRDRLALRARRLGLMAISRLGDTEPMLPLLRRRQLGAGRRRPALGTRRAGLLM